MRQDNNCYFNKHYCYDVFTCSTRGQYTKRATWKLVHGKMQVITAMERMAICGPLMITQNGGMCITPSAHLDGKMA